IAIGKIGEARSTARVVPVAQRAVVAEQALPILAHVRHQLRISEDAFVRSGLDSIQPLTAFGETTLHLGSDRIPVVGTQQSARESRAGRPGRHQYPVT